MLYFQTNPEIKLYSLPECSSIKSFKGLNDGMEAKNEQGSSRRPTLNNPPSDFFRKSGASTIYILTIFIAFQCEIPSLERGPCLLEADCRQMGWFLAHKIDFAEHSPCNQKCNPAILKMREVYY